MLSSMLFLLLLEIGGCKPPVIGKWSVSGCVCVCVRACVSARDCVGKRFWWSRDSCRKGFLVFPSILCPACVEVPGCVWVCFVLRCANFAPSGVLGCATKK